MHVARGSWLYLFFAGIGCLAIGTEAIWRIPVSIGIPGSIGIVMSWKTYIEVAILGVAIFCFLAWQESEQ